MNHPALSGEETPTPLFEIRTSIQNLLSDDFTTRGISLEQLKCLAVMTVVVGLFAD